MAYFKVVQSCQLLCLIKKKLYTLLNLNQIYKPLTNVFITQGWNLNEILIYTSYRL